MVIPGIVILCLLRVKLVYEITDNAFIVSLSGEGCLVLGN